MGEGKKRERGGEGKERKGREKPAQPTKNRSRAADFFSPKKSFRFGDRMCV